MSAANLSCDQTVMDLAPVSRKLPTDAMIRVAVLGCVTLVVAAGQPEFRENVPQVVSRVVPVALLAALGLTAAGTGQRVMDALRFDPGRGLLRLSLAVNIGWSVLSVVLLLLATVSVFVPPVVIAVSGLAFCTAGLGFDGKPCGLGLVRQIRPRVILAAFSRNRMCVCCGGATGLVVLLSFLWSCGPVWDWDSEMYHLPNARHVVEHHGLAPSLDQPLLNLPGQMYLWYAAGLMAGSESFAALLMWFATCMTAVTLAAFLHRHVGVTAALWAPLVYWSGGITVALSTTPRVEPFYCLMFLTSIVILLPGVVRQCRPAWSELLLAGICLGTSAGTKYQGLFGWVVVGGWLFVAAIARRDGRRLGTLLRYAQIFLIAFAVTAPWWVKNLTTWGNPVYPMYHSYDSMVSGSTASLAHANPYGSHSRSSGSGMLTDSYRLFARPSEFDGPPHQAPHYLFLTLPLLLVLRPSRTVLHMFLLGLVWYVLSLSLSHNLRHMSGMFALWSGAVGFLIARARPGTLRGIVLPVALMASLAFQILTPARISRLPYLCEYLVGAGSERDLLATVSPGFYATIDWLNQNTPADARVIMCWDARQYRLRRICVADPGGRNWDLLTAPDSVSLSVDQLSDRDYLLVSKGKLAYEIQKGAVDPARLEQVERIASERLEHVYSSGSVSIYRKQNRGGSKAG